MPSNAAASSSCVRCRLVQAGALVRIRHNEEVIAAAIAPVGGLQGDLDTGLDDLRLDGSGQVETLADRTRGGHHMID
tara:strand:- start:230 stop:460 length:231 start_codon:yes stop_codon:yes gene_type:complete